MIRQNKSGNPRSNGVELMNRWETGVESLRMNWLKQQPIEASQSVKKKRGRKVKVVCRASMY